MDSWERMGGIVKTFMMDASQIYTHLQEVWHSFRESNVLPTVEEIVASIFLEIESKWVRFVVHGTIHVYICMLWLRRATSSKEKFIRAMQQIFMIVYALFSEDKILPEYVEDLVQKLEHWLKERKRAKGYLALHMRFAYFIKNAAITVIYKTIYFIAETHNTILEGLRDIIIYTKLTASKLDLLLTPNELMVLYWVVEYALLVQQFKDSPEFV